MITYISQIDSSRNSCKAKRLAWLDEELVELWPPMIFGKAAKSPSIRVLDMSTNCRDIRHFPDLVVIPADNNTWEITGCWRVESVTSSDMRPFSLDQSHFTLHIVFDSSNLCQMTWPHHGPAVSRFLVINGSTNGTGCLRGLRRLIKTHFENISGMAFWDRDPRYPNRVPWDQK